MGSRKYRVTERGLNGKYVDAEYRIVRSRLGHRWIGNVARVHVTDAPIGYKALDFDVVLNGPGASKADRKVRRELRCKYQL
jgi:hypothetical protein